MKSTLEMGTEKEYFVPVVEIHIFDCEKDILCMSTEGKDNDFGAGDLSGFVD